MKRSNAHPRVRPFTPSFLPHCPPLASSETPVSPASPAFLRALGFNTADYLHVQIEAKKLAFADRAKYYADPDFAPAPLADLLSKDYAAQRRARIDMARAARAVPAGHFTGHWSDQAAAGAQAAYPRDGDTIALTTAAADGSMVSLVQSNFHNFGSGLAVPEVGFVLQNRGALYSMDPGDADVYAPGKRPFHTIIPGFATRDEKPWLSFAVMGGSMQPQGQVVYCAAGQGHMRRR